MHGVNIRFLISWVNIRQNTPTPLPAQKHLRLPFALLYRPAPFLTPIDPVEVFLEFGYAIGG